MRLNQFNDRSPCRHGRQQGLSIVELMVGVAIGLLIVSGTISLFVNSLGNSRRMTVESRVNQELRAAADLISRDLRRAGYWANSVNGTVATGVASVTAPNPYIAVDDDTSEITYNFTRDATENDALDTNEQFGFRLNGGAIEMQTDGAPSRSQITNPNLVTITGFDITPRVSVLPVGDVCQHTCVLGEVSPEGTNCPTLTVRQYDIKIQGNAVSDALVKRELQTSVRVRNDQFAGVCPLS